MSNPLRTPEDYELFIYSLIDHYPQINQSTLTFIRIGASMARVTGDLFFERGFRLAVRERLIFDRLPVILDSYSYEVWRRDEKLIWYDPQPHPGDPDLQATYPHHKHVHPNIKHHRVLAPGLSFSDPNLTHLIGEIIALIDSEA
jgi:hypothetical protein